MTKPKIISITSTSRFIYGLGDNNKLYVWLTDKWILSTDIKFEVKLVPHILDNKLIKLISRVCWIFVLLYLIILYALWVVK